MRQSSLILFFACFAHAGLAVAADDYSYQMLGTEHPCAPNIAASIVEGMKASGTKLENYPFELRVEGYCTHQAGAEGRGKVIGNLDACKKALDADAATAMQQLVAECTALCRGVTTKWTVEPRLNPPAKALRWLVDGMGQTEQTTLIRKSTGLCL